jgi:hypothetical protein
MNGKLLGFLERSDAVDLIQRLAQELGTTSHAIPIRIDDNGNLWIGERCAATIRTGATT